MDKITVLLLMKMRMRMLVSLQLLEDKSVLTIKDFLFNLLKLMDVVIAQMKEINYKNKINLVIKIKKLIVLINKMIKKRNMLYVMMMKVKKKIWIN
jgi:hypothetical protein